jgi:phage/plasmid-like protein (TIGR03299 family)
MVERGSTTLEGHYIMAHAIETINGVAQIAYAGETPWHGLGTKVPSDLTPEQMLKAAGLDWKVYTQPVFTEINGKRIELGKQALIRDLDNKVLDVISEDWLPMQNTDAFDFFNDFIAAGEMKMETAGSLKDGNIIWALAEITDSFELFGGRDVVKGYLHFTNPHQYGRSIDVRFTPIRVVCNNTLTLSLNTKTENFVKVNHRREFIADEVKETLGIAKEKLAKYKEMAQFLSTKRFTGEKIEEYFARVFPVATSKADSRKEISKAHRIVRECVDTQPGAELGEGTWWQAFNAVTYYTDHLAGRTQDTRLQSAWYGANKNLKPKALQIAVDMAEAA